MVLNEPAKRGESIKPGVKRSGTPGSLDRKRRAREAGDSLFVKAEVIPTAIARFARSKVFSWIILGFRFPSPQALCFHPLRGF